MNAGNVLFDLTCDASKARRAFSLLSVVMIRVAFETTRLAYAMASKPAHVEHLAHKERLRQLGLR